MAKSGCRESKQPHVDIAIVGSGIAGLYLASRLLSEPVYQVKSIALFDTANRVGGRILSVILPEVPYIAELGAMRYLPEQILTRSIIQNRLQLECSDFTFETEGYFLRRKYISQEAFAAARAMTPPRNAFPYDVDDSEIGKSPIELIVLSIQRALRALELPPEIGHRSEAQVISIGVLEQKLRDLSEKTYQPSLVTHFTSKEWRLIKRYGRINGRALYEIAFWDLIQQFLSREAYNLVYDGSGGYQHLNAADAIVWFLSDFAGSPYRTVVGGMGRLVEKLRQEIENRAQSSSNDGLQVFNLGWNLCEIRHLAKGKNGPVQLTFTTHGGAGGAYELHRSISATTAILALPQPALKTINFYDFQIERGDSSKRAAERFNTMLDSVIANPLFKACALYDKPWWREDRESSCFRVFTDLPLRQIYHFGPARQCKVSASSDRRSACMIMLFVDARYVHYWKGLEEMDNARSDFEELINERSRREVVGGYRAGNAVVTRVQELLAKVAGKDVPRPEVLIQKNWRDWPYRTGWHAWTVGARSWEVSEKLVRPFLDADLFICGEAFSGEQGWIEGALKSTERVLERMGLSSPPSWVDKAEYEEQKELWI
jgi:monoamine oxidase